MLTTKAKPMNERNATKADDQDWPALLARVAQHGDRDAFRKIYSYFAPRIKAYAINQGFGQHAEVLVQEVMTNVWRNADKYSEALASVSTWIFTISRNQRIDLLRKMNRTKAEVVIETEELWQIPMEDTTVRSIQNASTEKCIRESIDTLPEEQMIAVRKVYYEGKTHQEVAEELNIPLGTLKGRLRLSLKKLRVMLEATEL
ncbi:sigma-70 family RNA polymerase sigma factor [Cellvibrio sp. PSBB006]|uniref:sigma-70 family RNA polymerase sigma factor n=1 Tax=Cellvibrio sp. PSBB006 TaxID=1987723 RepID=UPI000B55555A|nr:sigma-70 family RNA polymerase sigma factor [Cellvibrio sp. PSBB006]ARU27820.1 RNA polymerase subunit sigma-24 [Cellvibrio sp. PSBB006]